ncbi:MAG: MATE family efflux transporter [Methanomicrobiaceae archaeon]|nr:MATE family efflux transporter [Methanomicrobiaceae archaeon]
MSNKISQPFDGADSDFKAGMTEGVTLLTGDPKSAIIKLSMPMIVAMLLFSVYNLVDGIWVAGLGPDALAAVGFVMPVFMILIGLGNGLGAGVNSTISRLIGSKNKAAADNAGVHSLIFVTVLSVIITIPLILLLEPIMVAMGADSATGQAVIYGQIVFAGTILFLFTNIGYAMLRAEGDAKKPMYAMTISAVLNMILDPVMIYWMGWGIAGAAWATIISVSIVSLIMLYWFFVKRESYLSLRLRYFSYSKKILKDILGVGIPASFEFFLMSIVLVIINLILVDVSGTDSVAVYTGGWRVVMFAIIPMAAIATASVSVYGANFGARRFENLRTTLNFSVKIGILISLITAVVTWVFAPQITLLFTYTPESANLAQFFIGFLQTMCLFYPFVALGMMSSSLFQGTGKGVTSFVINLFRNLVFIAVFAYVMGVVLEMGQVGVWYGIVLGDIFGGILGYVWAVLYLRVLIKHEACINSA